MKEIARIIYVLILVATCIGIPLYCLAEEEPADANPEDIAKLIEEAKGYIEEGNKEGAILTLDLAFDLADSIGDYEALMEIGDLYLAVDKSLDGKAMEAWRTAGRCKTRE